MVDFRAWRGFQVHFTDCTGAGRARGAFTHRRDRGRTRRAGRMVRTRSGQSEFSAVERRPAGALQFRSTMSIQNRYIHSLIHRCIDSLIRNPFLHAQATHSRVLPNALLRLSYLKGDPSSPEQEMCTGQTFERNERTSDADAPERHDGTAHHLPRSLARSLPTASRIPLISDSKFPSHSCPWIRREDHFLSICRRKEREATQPARLEGRYILTCYV